MELHKWIRVLPMPAGRVATVDERDVHIRMIDEGIGEGHAHRPRAHNEVVGLQGSRRHDVYPVERLPTGSLCAHSMRSAGASCLTRSAYRRCPSSSSSSLHWPLPPLRKNARLLFRMPSVASGAISSARSRIVS